MTQAHDSGKNLNRYSRTAIADILLARLINASSLNELSKTKAYRDDNDTMVTNVEVTSEFK